MLDKFLKGKTDDVRFAYGMLAGIVGIGVNIILFGIKFATGLITNSVAILADAFNNLGDVGSSVLTIMGFKFASLPPDKEHPFGHGRIEYITSLIISIVIMIIGFQFLRDSFNRILKPTKLEFGWVTIVTLFATIIVKLWLGWFNKKLGEKIDSEVLQANSLDSFSDVVATLTVVFSLIISRFVDIPVDGFIGLLVSLFIMYSGYGLIRESVDLLIGSKADPKLAKKIKEMVKSYEGILGIHDLMIHNYGPGQCVVSLHAELSEKMPIMKAHNLIDTIERDLSEKLNIEITIHMDPINLDDEEINKTRKEITNIISKIPEIDSFHDLRVVGKGDHKNVIFDVVVSFDIKPDEEEEFKNMLIKKIRERHPGYNAVITIDRKYA